MANRTHHTALRAGLAICALLFSACSYDRASFEPTQKTSIEPASAPLNIQVIGKVAVDEFNDEATGKEVPAKGGQIVVRFNAEPQTMNNWRTTADAYSQYIGT